MSVKSFWVNSPKIGKNVKILDNKIHYIEHEGEEKVILLHGLGFSMFAMRNIYQELTSKGYGVIAIDLPGCGYSTMNQRQKFTVEHTADLIYEFMKVQKIDSAHFFGVAEGGIYALCISQLYPERVKSLTLCSPGSLTNSYPFFYKQLISPMVGEILVNFLNRHRISKFLKWIYFNKTKITPSIEKQTYEPFERRATRNWLIYLLRDYNDSAVYSHLYLVNCPVLLVWGEYDNAHPVAMSQRLLESIRHSTLEIVKNVGHMVYEIRAPLVVDFMEKTTLKGKTGFEKHLIE
ncbi:MAG: alpha/beta hydrolase [Eubacteriales bacterium]